MIKTSSRYNYFHNMINILKTVNINQLVDDINQYITQQQNLVLIYFNDHMNHVIITNDKILDDDDLHNPIYNTLIFKQSKITTFKEVQKHINDFIFDSYHIYDIENDALFESKVAIPKITIIDNNISITPFGLESYSLEYLYQIFNKKYLLEKKIFNMFFKFSYESVQILDQYIVEESITKLYMSFIGKIIYNNLISNHPIPIYRDSIYDVNILLNYFHKDISKSSSLTLTMPIINRHLLSLTAFYYTVSYFKIDLSSNYQLFNSTLSINFLNQIIQKRLQNKNYTIIKPETIKIINQMYNYACLFRNNQNFQNDLLILKKTLKENDKNPYLIKESNLNTNLCHFLIDPEII